MTKYIPLVAIVLILAVTTYLKFAAVANYNFAITYDQGRDLMEIRSIVVGHRPALVGPTTSINGAFLGPFYYYFNVIPFYLGGGDPAWIMSWQIFWYQLTGLLIFFFFNDRKQTSFGTIFTSLYLLMPIGFYINRFFWNIAPMTPVTAWLMLLNLSTMEKPTKLKLLLLGILTGIALQIEAAFGILMLPLAILFLMFFRSSILQFFRKFSSLSIGFGITLIPQLIYELRHNFSITKTLFAQFTGQSNILSQSLIFSERLADRWHHYLRIVIDTSHLPPWFAIGIFTTSLIYIIYKLLRLTTNHHNREYKLPITYYQLPIILISLSLILYLIFPQQLKSWYLDALSIPTIFIIALFLTHTCNYHATVRGSYHKLLVAIILLLTFLFTTKEQLTYLIRINTMSRQDPSNLANQIQVIDWIYQQANHQPFQVYSYLPSVYDHAYQHVFWWYGTKTYGYQPAKIAYADGHPAYVKSQNKLWSQTKPLNSNSPTFLIIEPDPKNPQRQSNWLNDFNAFCITKKHTFPWNTRTELRVTCQ